MKISIQEWSKVNYLIERTIKFTKAKIALVFSKNLKRNAAETRFIVWYNLVKYAGFSSVKAGFVFNRDHSTVLCGIKKYEILREVDETFKIETNEIEKDFCNKFPVIRNNRTELQLLSNHIFTSQNRQRSDIGKILIR